MTECTATRDAELGYVPSLDKQNPGNEKATQNEEQVNAEAGAAKKEAEMLGDYCGDGECSQTV